MVIRNHHIKLEVLGIKNFANTNSSAFFVKPKPCLISCDLWVMCIIRKIRSFLTEHAAQLLVQVLVISRLDYCNTLLAGLPSNTIKPLQMIQNAAARLVFNEPNPHPLMSDSRHHNSFERIHFNEWLRQLICPTLNSQDVAVWIGVSFTQKIDHTCDLALIIIIKDLILIIHNFRLFIWEMCSKLSIKSFSLVWSEVKPAQSYFSASCSFYSDVW